VVIEHNLEVIKTDDWIIDLGPEGGGGAGQPEEIVRAERSYTGAFLKPVLGRKAAALPAGRTARRCAGRHKKAMGQ
jgi:excinuclease ABC subunit A